jgi:hypothetical protein
MCQIISNTDVHVRHSLIGDALSRFSENKKIMVASKEPFLNANVLQVRAGTKAERASALQTMARFDPDVMVLDGVPGDEVEYYQRNRGFDMIIGCVS